MDAWDGFLFVLAATIAIRSLVYLARRRHDLLVREVQEQVDAHRARLEKERENQPKKRNAA